MAARLLLSRFAVDANAVIATSNHVDGRKHAKTLGSRVSDDKAPMMIALDTLAA